MTQEKPYPPDSLLELVGLTRDEWDKMSHDIPEKRDIAIMEALQASVRRRANADLAERTEPYRKPTTK